MEALNARPGAGRSLQGAMSEPFFDLLQPSSAATNPIPGFQGPSSAPAPSAPSSGYPSIPGVEGAGPSRSTDSLLREVENAYGSPAPGSNSFSASGTVSALWAACTSSVHIAA